MRPWMAASLFLIALLMALPRKAAAQQSQPRSFPELRELMQSDDPPRPARTKSSDIVQAVAVSQPDETEFVTPIVGHSEAWPAGPRPSHITEPAAAPPATPLEAPPELPGPSQRIVTSSPMHTLQVHPQIPQEPPLLPELQTPIQTAQELTLDDNQFIAPPMSSRDYSGLNPPGLAQNSFVSNDQLTPIPASPPEPAPFVYASDSTADTWEEEAPVFTGDTMTDPSEAFIPYDPGMGDMATVGGTSYRNLYPPDPRYPTDSCGRFLPFGNLGIKPGNDRVIGGGGFFIPLWQNCDSLVFTELRGNADDRNSGDGMIGVGYRTYLNPRWIFGTYIYGDLIATNQNNVFGQGQLGFELLALNWDIRFNGYAPGQAVQGAYSQNGISNGTAITRNFGERAYRGFDFEIGYRCLNWGLNDKYEVRWFWGGYGFGDSSQTYPSFGGPRTRIEMRVYDLPWCGQQSRLEFGGEFSYDRVRREQAFGYLRVRIPFGARQNRPALDPMRRRMVDTPVHRVD